MGCISTVTDAVMRLKARGGEESEFSAHYAGWGPGPGKAFGFQMHGFMVSARNTGLQKLL